MTAARQLSRAEILALPPVITLETLGEVLGVSEPVIRRLNASGELAALGIRVNRLGAQWRVITADIVAFLGYHPRHRTGQARDHQTRPPTRHPPGCSGVSPDDGPEAA